MTVYRSKLQQLYAMQEVTWITDPSASGAGYSFLKSVGDVALSLDAEVIERPGMTGDFTRQPSVVGPKNAKVSFKLECKGSGTAAASGVPAIASEASILLESILGTVVRGTGTVCGVGSTTTSIVCTSTAGLSKYMMVSIGGETRFITAIADATHFTVDRALSGAPAAAVVIYASSLFKRALTGHKSMSFVVRIDSIEYMLSGCHGTVKLEGVNARGTALLAFEFTAATWASSAKGSLPSSDVTGITAVKAPVIKGAPFAVAGVEDVISGLDFDPGMKFEFQESTAAADAKASIVNTGAEPKGSIKPFYSAAHLTDFNAGTEQSLAFATVDPTNGFGLYVPRMQYTGHSLDDRAGLVGQPLPFSVNDNVTDCEYSLCLF